MPVPIAWMHVFIDVPPDLVDPAREFWSAVTGWPPTRPWEAHPEFVSLTPPDGMPYVHVQTIEGPPRVHLDLLGDADRDAVRVEQLGARAERAAEWWRVMSSPAGLAFCVCGEHPAHARPGPATWPDGHRSRVVQLCVDVPSSSYDAEVAFWRAATGWADEPVNAPEFHRLVHRASSPVQLLVQRLRPDDRADVARAHIDLGTDDIRAEVARVVRLGATVESEREGITVLRDPIGLPMCVTGNSPDVR
jgi:hypothetical protein